MTATQTRIRRDTLTNLNAATPADGELAYNTTDDRLHVGNGTLAGAIPHLHCYDDIKSYFHYATTGGSSNAYTLTLPYAPASYVAGMRVRIKASFSNTGSATIDVNSLGTKTIKKVSSGVLSALSSGDMISGLIYELVYDGTDFQLFGFEMAGTLPGVVKLGSVTASASATLDFNSLISATYDSYTMILKNLTFNTSTTDLWLRTSTDNGSTFDAGANNYTFGTSGALSTSDTKIVLNDSGLSGLNASDGISGKIDFINPLNSANYKPFFWEIFSRDGSTIYRDSGCGVRGATADIDAIRLLPDTGTITSGEVDFYGWRA